MQKLGGVDADSYTGAYFGVLGCLLVDVDADVVGFAVVVEGEGGEEAADSAADDGDSEWFCGVGGHCLCVGKFVGDWFSGVMVLSRLLERVLDMLHMCTCN